MTAIADIRAAIARAQLERQNAPTPIIGRRTTLVVRVGPSAEQAIVAETTDRRLPVQIDGLLVERTGDFLGWEIG